MFFCRALWLVDLAGGVVPLVRAALQKSEEHDEERATDEHENRTLDQPDDKRGDPRQQGSQSGAQTASAQRIAGLGEDHRLERSKQARPDDVGDGRIRDELDQTLLAGFRGEANVVVRVAVVAHGIDLFRLRL